MIIDRNILKEYPYKGEFYTNEIDRDLPLDEQSPTHKTICEVDCDIQQDRDAEKINSLICIYNVFVGLKKDENVPIKRGCLFKGEQRGLNISGKVISVAVSELGGYVAKIDTSEI